MTTISNNNVDFSGMSPEYSRIWVSVRTNFNIKKSLEKCLEDKGDVVFIATEWLHSAIVTGSPPEGQQSSLVFSL